MNIRILLFFGLSILITGCGEKASIEDAVRERLRDPDSATFKDVIVSSDNLYSCVVWNAKNGLGGYGDWSVAELKNKNSEWIVLNMQLPEHQIQDHCSEAQMESNVRFRKTMDELKNLN